MTKWELLIIGAIAFSRDGYKIRLNDELGISLLVKVWCIILLIVLFLIITHLVETNRKSPKAVRWINGHVQGFCVTALVIWWMPSGALMGHYSLPVYAVGINALAVLGQIIYIGVLAWAVRISLR